MSLRIRGTLFAVLGLSGLIAAALSTPFRLVGLGVAFVFLFLAGSAFSTAARIASSLLTIVNKPVRVAVWGLPLPGCGDAVFEIDSISAFGAGLLIYLRPGAGARRSLLKVAQPTSARLQEGEIEIGDAAYVSWAGTKLKPAVGKHAPALVLFT
jgi:hypothetical protein